MTDGVQTPWSPEEQLLLEEGLREFASVNNQKEKWRGIAARVGTRGAKDCALRYKQVREEALRGRSDVRVTSSVGHESQAAVKADAASASAKAAAEKEAKAEANAAAEKAATEHAAAEKAAAEKAAVEKKAADDAAAGARLQREAAEVAKRRAAEEAETAEKKRTADEKAAREKAEAAEKKRAADEKAAREKAEVERRKQEEQAKVEASRRKKDDADRQKEEDKRKQEASDKHEEGNKINSSNEKAQAVEQASSHAPADQQEAASGSRSQRGQKGSKAERGAKGGKGDWYERRSPRWEEQQHESRDWDNRGDEAGTSWKGGGKKRNRKGQRNGKGGEQQWESRTEDDNGEDADNAWKGNSRKGNRKGQRNGKGEEQQWESKTEDDNGEDAGKAWKGNSRKGNRKGQRNGKGEEQQWESRTEDDNCEDAENAWKGNSRKGNRKGQRNGKGEEQQWESRTEDDNNEDAGKAWKGNSRKGDCKGQRNGKGGEQQRESKTEDDNGEDADKAWKGNSRREDRKGQRREKGDSGKKEAAAGPGAPIPLMRDASMPLRERLVMQLKRGSYDCMICMSKVGRGAAIWSCQSCSAVFHLKCTHGWIKKSNDGNDTRGKSTGFSWPCPGCRYMHVERRMPEYTCFCGRILEPELSPHYTPHTCGEACERKRDNCPHACGELCHPGPCPPCTAIGGPGKCHCGREKKDATRCGEPPTWSCGEACDRPLGCGKHRCELRCHTGRCPPCALTEEITCHCGKHTEQRPCGGEVFSCATICGKKLTCGHHTCEQLCHEGACRECRLAPETWGEKCACGKADTSTEAAAALLVRFAPRRKTCADRLSLCGNLCGRRSISGCGHSCSRSCHEGACGPCAAKVEQRCRCGQNDRKVDCFTATTENGGVYTCKTVCKTKKSCLRHRCEDFCCPVRDQREHEIHMCLIVCGRPLECGSHNCEDICHLGNCPPCRVVHRTPLTCACGEETLDPPYRCGTQPPFCTRPCGEELGCGHHCRASCHFGDHPLCSELVAKECVGGHGLLPPLPCHVPPGTCGRPCGLPLPGCSHHCRKSCHLGECMRCEDICGNGRLHCEHRCAAKCHAGEECPDEPCAAKVRVSCKCGARIENVPCGACEDNKRPQFKNLPCGPACRGGHGGGDAVRRSVGAGCSRFDNALVMLAESCGVQFVRFIEQRFEDLLPPARPGPSITINLSRADVTGGRRGLVVELARVHYGLLHRSGQVDAKGGLQLTFNAEASAGSTSTRRPHTKLSTLLTSGGDVSDAFAATGPLLRFGGLPRAEEVAEELCYELLSDEETFNFRVRIDKDGFMAMFVSPTIAAAAFQRLTRQAASTEMQEVRRLPQERAQRIAKIGAKPRVALTGREAAAALAELRHRSGGASQPASTGGSPWGKGGSVGGGAGSGAPSGAPSGGGGSAWGRGPPATSSGGSAWGPRGKGGSKGGL
eukprot:TRINITY_DN12010_c0_g1_i3.p1 TRINITY_DN12010_c0_g1~~TRINITY_DN12010_c0_g1_i3.p1  ORF type:complete len:1443 (+),score=311.57 TRINITY_DN12010_c0_g1_i3:129-4457(+)